MRRPLKRRNSFRKSPDTIQGEEAAKSRHTFELAASHPRIPPDGHRGAIHFGEIAELDLLITENLTALIYVDAATRLTYISKITRKQPETVWNVILHMWVKQHGLPDQITSDSGGEFSEKWIADQGRDAGIRLATKSRRPRVLLAEFRSHTAKEVLRRLQLEYPDTSNGHLPHLIPRRPDKMLNEDSVSADQAVFGRSHRDITHIPLSDPVDI